MPHEQRRRVRLRESTRNPRSGSSGMLAEGLVEKRMKTGEVFIPIGTALKEEASVILARCMLTKSTMRKGISRVFS
jgi:hypothetical protein